MSTLLQDLKYGLRMLAKSPGFTAVAVLTLALGIGANTAVFSSVNALLLHPFAFKDSDQIMAVWETVPKQNESHVSASPANFRDWREQNKTFELLAAHHGWSVNLTGTGFAERLEGYRVTSDFFSVLGVAAQLGRTIGAGDFQSRYAKVVNLSHGFWERKLGADPMIMGKTLLLDGEKFTVIGVMPADFDFPMGAEAWAPLELNAAEQADRSNHYLRVIGRLKTGVSRSRGQADLDAIAAHLAQQYPATNAGHGVRVVGLVEDLTSDSRQFLRVLMGSAVFVLLLACANVANLQLARASTREKEIAIRLALGARRRTIVRQLLVESVLLALLGGAAGVPLAAWGLELSLRSVPPFILQHVPGVKLTSVDSSVLAFTLMVATLTGILAGLAHALRASRTDLNEVLKQAVRGGGYASGSHRLRAVLVVCEVALALVLLVGAGLMVEGFRNLLNANPGFDRNHVLTFSVALPGSKYRDPDQVRGFYDQAIQRLQALPGVESAAAVTSLPGGWSWNRSEYTADDQPPAAPGELRLAFSQSISPDFFRALRIPVLRGRSIALQDGPNAPRVVVISDSMARRIWPNQDPLGKRIKFGRAESGEPWCTVVGVVADVKQSPFDTEVYPTAYFPLTQQPRPFSAVVVRTPGDPLALAAVARSEMGNVDPDQATFDIRTLDQVVSDNLSGVESSAQMMLAFGFIALVLAGSGIFAVVAYSVLQRTHEIGVRMALGARRAEVLRLVMGHAMKLALMGLVSGAACALGLSHALSSELFGVLRMDGGELRIVNCEFRIRIVK
ncbi:MAG: ABC transporter permease [Acidobacteria bacterium]|nr:ABC transporter permease [Acidobacteriota bacterium]